ncbi:MAG: GntR family transcriptional regulator [Candidatus Acidiferrales bacterium]
MAVVQEPLIQRETLQEKIFDVLKKWILDGTLKPGEKIVESTLARRLEVSRAPLREALFLLAQRGFVTIRTHRGAYVTRLSNRDIREIFEIREILEIHAAKRLRTKLVPENVTRLKAALERLKAATDARDIAAFSEADFGFHKTLWELSGNHQVSQVLVNLTTRFFGYEQIRDMANSPRFLYESVFEDHARMFQLILEGTDQELENGFHNSFETFLKYVLTRFQEQEPPEKTEPAS